MKIAIGDVDCSAFIPVQDIAKLKMADAGDGLRHELEFHGADGTAYVGPAPYMIQSNVCGFLQRENGLAQARRSGYRWRHRGPAGTVPRRAGVD